MNDFRFFIVFQSVHRYFIQFVRPHRTLKDIARNVYISYETIYVRDYWPILLKAFSYYFIIRTSSILCARPTTACTRRYTVSRFGGHASEQTANKFDGFSPPFLSPSFHLSLFISIILFSLSLSPNVYNTVSITDRSMHVLCIYDIIIHYSR